MAKDGQDWNDNKHAANWSSIVRLLEEICADKHPKDQEENAVLCRAINSPYLSAFEGGARAKQGRHDD